MTTPPRRAVLLARVSRGERQQDPTSQLVPLRAAAQRLGLEIAEEISLVQSAWDAASAADVRRRALAPIVEGRADVLMVWALDRLVRGGIETAFAFLRELEEHLGASLFSLQEPFLSTATSDRQTRELMVALLSWIARWESQRRSERLRAKADTKRNRAAALNQRAGWGRRLEGLTWGRPRLPGRRRARPAAPGGRPQRPGDRSGDRAQPLAGGPAA
jgi:DNA invertase Pin-like site-specific DNA recombinase